MIKSICDYFTFSNAIRITWTYIQFQTVYLKIRITYIFLHINLFSDKSLPSQTLRVFV